MHASCVRALGARDDAQALDIVASCCACECSYDGDGRHVQRALRSLERRMVTPILQQPSPPPPPPPSFLARVMKRTFSSWLKKTPTDDAKDYYYFEAVEVSKTTSSARALVLETCDAVFYAFAGTQTAKDLLSDANFWLTPVASGARAHRGFVNRAESVAMDVAYDRARASGRRLVMCGHSLGGATATLATLMLLLRRPEAAKHVRCVAFACPPLGNAQLTQLVNDRDWADVFTNIAMPEDRIVKILKSRPGYVGEFVPTRYLLQDGRVVVKTDGDNDEAEDDHDGNNDLAVVENANEAVSRALRESASFGQPRSAVYAHAMKTYRQRLIAALRIAAPQSFVAYDDNDGISSPAMSSRQHDSSIIELRQHLGPSATFIRAVGVLTRDGTRVAALARGAHIDARTCSRFKATVNGWACATSSATVLSPDALLIYVSAPLLHGAPLPSDSMCSTTDEKTWMPLTIGAAGDFSMTFVDVRMIPRRALLDVTSDQSNDVVAAPTTRSNALDAHEIKALLDVSNVSPRSRL